MKQFLAVYTGSEGGVETAGWNALSEKEKQEKMITGKDAWMNWVMEHKKSIVYQGGPLGKTKKTSKSGISDIRNQMTGFTVVQAESHDAAAKLFLNHPHFAIFPGEAVEIMECMPIPQ